MPSNFYSANVTIIKLQRNISISVHYFVRIAYTYYTHYDSDTRSLRYTSNGNPSLTQLFSEILKYSYQPLFYNSKFSTILSDNDTLNDKTLDNRSIQLHAFPKPKYTNARTLGHATAHVIQTQFVSIAPRIRTINMWLGSRVFRFPGLARAQLGREINISSSRRVTVEFVLIASGQAVQLGLPPNRAGQAGRVMWRNELLFTY